jgi:hypothetical protein
MQPAREPYRAPPVAAGYSSRSVASPILTYTPPQVSYPPGLDPGSRHPSGEYSYQNPEFYNSFDTRSAQAQGAGVETPRYRREPYRPELGMGTPGVDDLTPNVVVRTRNRSIMSAVSVASDGSSSRLNSPKSQQSGSVGVASHSHIRLCSPVHVQGGGPVRSPTQRMARVVSPTQGAHQPYINYQLEDAEFDLPGSDTASIVGNGLPDTRAIVFSEWAEDVMLGGTWSDYQSQRPPSTAASTPTQRSLELSAIRGSGSIEGLRKHRRGTNGNGAGSRSITPPPEASSGPLASSKIVWFNGKPMFNCNGVLLPVPAGTPIPPPPPPPLVGFARPSPGNVPLNPSLLNEGSQSSSPRAWAHGNPNHSGSDGTQVPGDDNASLGTGLPSEELSPHGSMTAHGVEANSFDGSPGTHSQLFFGSPGASGKPSPTTDSLVGFNHHGGGGRGTPLQVLNGGGAGHAPSTVPHSFVSNGGGFGPAGYGLAPPYSPSSSHAGLSSNGNGSFGSTPGYPPSFAPGPLEPPAPAVGNWPPQIPPNPNGQPHNYVLPPTFSIKIGAPATSAKSGKDKNQPKRRV